ncbi:HNH endonuclease signature motif containing protein [Modestobacter versicolor]|uniref:HNH endonuclease signature motif containing protein n=1 Tax=Modestobacter versicolor TaxID=429133 RepID=UPI0034DDE7FC
MFDGATTSAVLDDEWLQGALDELNERWRAAAGAPSPGPGQRLAAQLEAGALHLSEIRSAQAVIGAQEARRARAIAAFCRCRPASLDRPASEIGAAAAATRAARPSALTTVSEWAVDEVAVALSLGESGASRLVVQSLHLVERLPGTLRALETGRLSWEHARVMSEVVAPLDDDLRGQAEDRLLARLGSKTPTQLRAAAHRVVARLDAEAVLRRIREAVLERRVGIYPTGDGMGSLCASGLPMPVLRAVEDALRQYADAAAVPGDERTRAQRMADCLVDLVLRPGEHGLAPVQAQLTVVATPGTLDGTDDEPGEVNGDLVPAGMVRRLAETLGVLHPDDAVPDDAVPDDAVDARPRLAHLWGDRSSAGTASARRPDVAVVDELTGQLLALTDAAGLRAGRPLGPPPPTTGYAPTAALRRFVGLRDRRCRFPGCRRRPSGCDLHHRTSWPAGPTAHDNLCSLCRHHHRLVHQAPGWRLRGLDDGSLEWRTPTGQVLVTHPPRFGADDDLPPPAAPDPPPF